jgi:predicted RNA binding protein YcfA (HicA-like mRNA interferase family)
MKDADGRVVSVPVHGSKTLPVGTIKSVIDKAGLTLESFRELL